MKANSEYFEVTTFNLSPQMKEWLPLWKEAVKQEKLREKTERERPRGLETQTSIVAVVPGQKSVMSPEERIERLIQSRIPKEKERPELAYIPEVRVQRILESKQEKLRNRSSSPDMAASSRGDSPRKKQEGTTNDGFVYNIVTGANTKPLEKEIANTYVGTIDPNTSKREGQGTYNFANKYFTYKGQYSSGRRNGEGELLLADGTVLKGRFTDGELEGVVRIEYANGNLYTGAYSDGEKNGKGEFISNHYCYSGTYLNGVWDGEGALDDKIRKERIEGTFEGGKAQGPNCVITKLDDGGWKEVYRGSLRQGLKHGFGTARHDLWTYKGNWADDLFDGKGLLVSHWYLPPKVLVVASKGEAVTRSEWTYEGNFAKGKRTSVPNKLIFYAFKEEWGNEPPKKDAKPGDKKPAAVAGMVNAKPSTGSLGTGEGEGGVDAPPIRRLEKIEGELRVQSGSAAGLSLLINVVYQGPSYPDPNPPPPDPKKKAAAPKKGALGGAPVEEEIPMITPPPVLMVEESCRTFRLDLLGPGPDEKSPQISYRLDFRKEIADMEALLRQKEELEAKTVPAAGTLGDKKDSRKNLIAQKATLAVVEENGINLYDPDYPKDKRPIYLQTTKGATEVLDLRFPDNFPGGNYTLKLTDLSPTYCPDLVERLPAVELELLVLAKDDKDGKGAKKPAGGLAGAAGKKK